MKRPSPSISRDEQTRIEIVKLDGKKRSYEADSPLNSIVLMSDIEGTWNATQSIACIVHPLACWRWYTFRSYTPRLDD